MTFKSIYYERNDMELFSEVLHYQHVEEVSYMNLELNYEGFEQHLIMKRDWHCGIQYIFKFPNGYGASVIKHRGSYGSDADLWELAVVEFIDEHDHWGIKYTTPITDNVLGWLRDEDVRDYLKEIEEL